MQCRLTLNKCLWPTHIEILYRGLKLERGRGWCCGRSLYSGWQWGYKGTLCTLDILIVLLHKPATLEEQIRRTVYCTVYTSCILFDCYPRLNCLRSVPNSPLLDYCVSYIIMTFKKSDLFASIHRLNMELDLQKFIWAPVYNCTHWLRLRNSSLPPHLGSCTRSLLVSQDRRHLSVTPCFPPSIHSSKYICLVVISAMCRAVQSVLHASYPPSPLPKPINSPG